MIFSEAFLPATGKLPFYARLYHNWVRPCVRPVQAHAHPALEIGYFPNFSGVCAVGEDELEIEPEDIFVFRSNEQHYFPVIHSDHECLTNSLQFFPELLWSDTDLKRSVKYNSVLSLNNTHFVNKLDKNLESTRQIRELFNMITYEFDHHETDHAFIIRNYLISIVSLICRQYDSVPLSSGTSIGSVSEENILHIHDAVAFIDEHYTENLSLKQLASVAHMSTSYFSQLFKKINGFSTWDYILSKRIAMAQNLIFNTDIPIYEIADRCGFNNTANFYKAFNKLNLKSPTECRAQRKLELFR